MKITAQEEYGLRILLRVGKADQAEGITIPEISNSEGLSPHNVAKLCRILRIAGLIKSSRGKKGGYLLSRPADMIYLNEVLEILGGKLFSSEFCATHSGVEKSCNNAADCTVRILWQILQNSLDAVLEQMTLLDLLQPGKGLRNERRLKNKIVPKEKWVS